MSVSAAFFPGGTTSLAVIVAVKTSGRDLRGRSGVLVGHSMAAWDNEAGTRPKSRSSYILPRCPGQRVG